MSVLKIVDHLAYPVLLHHGRAGDHTCGLKPYEVPLIREGLRLPAPSLSQADIDLLSWFELNSQAACGALLFGCLCGSRIGQYDWVPQWVASHRDCRVPLRQRIIDAIDESEARIERALVAMAKADEAEFKRYINTDEPVARFLGLSETVECDPSITPEQAKQQSDEDHAAMLAEEMGSVECDPVTGLGPRVLGEDEGDPVSNPLQPTIWPRSSALKQVAWPVAVQEIESTGYISTGYIFAPPPPVRVRLVRWWTNAQACWRGIRNPDRSVRAEFHPHEVEGQRQTYVRIHTADSGTVIDRKPTTQDWERFGREYLRYLWRRVLRRPTP